MSQRFFHLAAWLLVLTAACNGAPHRFTAAAGLAWADAPGARAAVRRAEAGVEAAVQPGPTADFLADFTRYFQEHIAPGVPGAALVIVRGDELLWCRGYGVRAAGSGQPVDAHTVFRIGSLSKGFAGVLTALHVQENCLNLDDPVQRWYPGFRLSDTAQARRVTVRHLLTHSAGLPYHTYTNMIEQGLDLSSLVARLADVRRLEREGAVFAYQNVAYSVSELCLQAATGSAYADLLRARILDPAGMPDASLSFEALEACNNKALPHHGLRGGGWAPTSYNRTYYNTCAAGGVNASAADMGQWLKLLLGAMPDVAPRPALDTAFRPVLRTGERRRFRDWGGEREAFYALGFRVLHWNDETVVCHSGSVNNYRGELAILPSENIGVCVLFNAPASEITQVAPAFFEKYRQYFPGPAVSLGGE